MEKFIIQKDFVSKVKKFGLQRRTIEFQIKPVPEGRDPEKWIHEALEEIIETAVPRTQPNYKVGFTFCGDSFAERGPAWMSFRDASAVKMEDVWNMLTKIFQSNSTGLATDTFCLGVTTVEMPTGKGIDRARIYKDFNEECAKRRGIIQIKNKDHLCLPRALVVAIALVNKDPEYTRVRLDKGKIQITRALNLMNEAGVTISQEIGAGIPELEKFQTYLSDYKIVVYAYGHKGRDVIFEGPETDGKTINLLYYRTHFNVIVSLTAAFCCKYYCERCHCPYNDKRKHRCECTCAFCTVSPPCERGNVEVPCAGCNRDFRGRQCYENHLRLNVCEKVTRCVHCFKVYKSEREHYCGEIFCNVCKKHVPYDHLCYIQPNNGEPSIKDTALVFYDLETRQETRFQRNDDEDRCEKDDPVMLHEPNLCVFAVRCDRCIEEKRLYFCQKCGYRLIQYKDNVIKNFMEYLLTLRKKFKSVIVLAHNGQAFDHQFVLNHILTTQPVKPSLIMRGTKIILMEFNNIKFLDSLNYLPMSLSALPKAFALGDSFKKGYFPHLFNTKANQNYIGPMPDQEYYSPGSMKSEDREKFLRWYNENRDTVFNFQKEFEEYCISDVEILTEACLKFRKTFMAECNVCPFTEACTIASACNLAFRRNFLKPNTIGLIPSGGYRWRDTQSHIAIEWLESETKSRGINIKHAANGFEAVLAGKRVDGYCAETGEVFEFHGCWYHGHSCIRGNRDTPLHNDPLDTLEKRLRRTEDKIKHLHREGFKVVEMWECDWIRQRGPREIRDIQTPLNPRDAFYGGRTGNCKTLYEVSPGEKIKYVDVTSLYPWVCKYAKFPIGHPEIIVGPELCREENLREISGLIKCRILPPQDLYHPVLPQKMNNKLMFVTCRSCGETMNQDECIHNADDRALEGTWIIDEVLKAIDKGYVLLDIAEIWKYKTVQFNKDTGEEGLFTSMMNKFIKIKQEASGWPSNCSTQEEKVAYIEEFLNSEGVQLEFTEIVSNPGLRSFAKLILNSFWGKFGQRENQAKTNIIDTPAELYEMLNNPNILVNNILPINDMVLVVEWEHLEEACNSLSTVNVAIAAFTTAHARLKLYSYLEKLGENVLYYDTDSIIFITGNDLPDVHTSDALGAMKNELECFGDFAYITKFSSGGPKNYSFTVFNPDTGKYSEICKIKGFTLNYETSQKLNGKIMEELVQNQGQIMINNKNIRRTKCHEVTTVPESKIYKPCSVKRKFLKDGSSIPYGYKRLKID